MNKSLLLGLLLASSPTQVEQLEYKLIEHCFEISPYTKIAIREFDGTPSKFLTQEISAQIAINGPYYGPDQKTEGIAYLSSNYHFGTERSEDTRGYFIVNRNGKPEVSETLEGKIEDKFLVIGTHPLLVTNGEIDSQAFEKRYQKIVSNRSAIGTKTGKDICFAVTPNPITIQSWAKILEANGYQGAINLDGGPESQLAIKKGNTIYPFGRGEGNTKLVIYSYKKQ